MCIARAPPLSPSVPIGYLSGSRRAWLQRQRSCDARYRGPQRRLWPSAPPMARTSTPCKRDQRPAHVMLQMLPHPPPPHRPPPLPRRTLTKPFPIFPQIAESWPAGSRASLYNMLASLPANPYLLFRCCSGALSRTFVRRKNELDGQPSCRSRRFAAPREGRSRCRPTIEWFALRPQAYAPGLFRRRSLEPEGQACARRDANRSKLTITTCIAPIFARERKAYGAGG